MIGQDGEVTDDPADEAIISTSQSLDGTRCEVLLVDGRLVEVFNTAWGYDEGDAYAHVTTNISPDVEGASIDVFRTGEVATITDQTGHLVWSDATSSG